LAKTAFGGFRGIGAGATFGAGQKAWFLAGRTAETDAGSPPEVVSRRGRELGRELAGFAGLAAIAPYNEKRPDLRRAFDHHDQ
jgi:hypothetical protein